VPWFCTLMKYLETMGSVLKLLLMPNDAGNLSTMIIALIFVVSCEVLGLTIIFVKTC
jgi:hypothetical protein